MNMKKQLLLFLLLLLPMAASADDSGTCGENLTWTYVEATKTLTISGSGDMYDYSPFAPWDYYRRQIQTAVIDSGVTSIGDYAFYYCTSLTSITIPDSVTIIGSYAFKNCSSLTSITLPSSVTTIGNSAFEDCSSLTSIAIPDSVTSIGYGAFYYCTSLTAVTIPSSMTSIDEYAFYGCTSLSSAIIPSSVTSIGENAFYGCSSLSGVTIPSSVTTIGGGAFCSTRLASITIPNSVTNIGYYAFYGCSSLATVTMGNSIKTIGDYAFANCPKMEDIYCYTARCPEVGILVFEDSNPHHILLHVPEEAVEPYKKAEPWCNFKDVVPLTSGDPEPDGIIDMHSQPVVIQSHDGLLTIEGAAEGTPVSIYDLAGRKVGSAKVSAEGTLISTSLRSGDISIVKMGGKTMKVMTR